MLLEISAHIGNTSCRPDLNNHYIEVRKQIWVWQLQMSLSDFHKRLVRMDPYVLGRLSKSCLPETRCDFRPNRTTADILFWFDNFRRSIMKNTEPSTWHLSDKGIWLSSSTTLKCAAQNWMPKKLVSMVHILHDRTRASVWGDGEFIENF